jgi:hypothetical protein
VAKAEQRSVWCRRELRTRYFVNRNGFGWPGVDGLVEHKIPGQAQRFPHTQIGDGSRIADVAAAGCGCTAAHRLAGSKNQHYGHSQYSNNGMKRSFHGGLVASIPGIVGTPKLHQM